MEVRESSIARASALVPYRERVGFGALLVGYYVGDDLVYAGKVGTGWDDATLRELRSRMDRLERKTPPFANPGDAGEDDPLATHRKLPSRGVHWITPEMVAEVGFTEWTDDGFLRHPRYEGLREDKEAAEVVRERPA